MVSVPPWNFDLTPFYLASSQEKKYLADPPPPPLPAPSKFWITWLSPPPPPYWNVPSPKKPDSFFKETKDLISNKEMREHIWTLKYEYTVANLKIKGELGFV